MDDTGQALWSRVKTIASDALDLEAPARAAFIDNACGDDAALRAEVVSLLDSTEAATPFFEGPIRVPATGLILPDSRIGQYRIVRELASGGMGSVFLAERDDGEFRQRVAIKVVRGGFGDAFLLERFREERRILATLEHANIARLLDGGTTPSGLPYVVMEFVEGQPIDAYCTARELPLRERLALFQQVCAAVQYAHQHLVVHRDIKAANILVTHDGVPKLLDFGIAKLIDTGAGGAAGAYTAVRIMTPESASPEQLSGRPVTVAADIYALGVLLYRLLTDASPYRAPIGSDNDLIRAVCEDVPDPPSARAGRGRVPPDIDVIVLKALRKEPERRYGSAGEMAEDIRRYLDGLPVLASPDSFRYRTGKFVSRHRVAVTASVALVLAVGAGVAATVWQARIAERERSRAERQFQAVRGLAQSVLGELHDVVRTLPGSTGAREILLRRATEYLDALARETTGNPTLARDVADGYIRLATVQGASGLANLGNRAGARASYRKAIALLEPLAGGDLGDRLNLAISLARLAAIEPEPGVRDGFVARARGVVEALSAGERSTLKALVARQVVWAEVANQKVKARDVAGARDAHRRQLEAAEESFELNPDDPTASRNLALAYKQLGAMVETLGNVDEAVKLYTLALDLDRRRVEQNPSQGLWRIDLSFSLGSLGAVQMTAGDFSGALRYYTEAVAIREKVVADDPAEDFAKLALARGYERLARICEELGDAASSVAYGRKRAEVFRQRLSAHPERDTVWAEYAENAFAAAQSARRALERLAPRARERRTLAATTGAILDDLASVQARWLRDRRGSALPPAAPVMLEERSRLAAVTK